MKKMLLVGIVAMSMVECLKGYDGWRFKAPGGAIAWSNSVSSVDPEKPLEKRISRYTRVRLMTDSGEKLKYKYLAGSVTAASIVADYASGLGLKDQKSLVCKRDGMEIPDGELVGPGRIDLFFEPRNADDQAIMAMVSTEGAGAN